MNSYAFTAIACLLSLACWSAETLEVTNKHLFKFVNHVLDQKVAEFKGCYRKSIRTDGEQSDWESNIKSANKMMAKFGVKEAGDVTTSIVEVSKSTRDDLAKSEYKYVLSLKLPKKTIEVALIEEDGKLYIAER